MNAEQRLYDALRPEQSTSIPLPVAVEYFMNVKLASGGLLPAEVEVLEKIATGKLSMEDLEDAADKGTLQGVRSAVAHNLLHGQKLKETKGERWGKGLGTAAGAVAGMLAGKGNAAHSAVRAGVGALAGHALGKTVGQSVDTPKTKKSAIEKGASGVSPAALMRLREALQGIDLDSLRDTAISGGVQGGAEGALSDTLSSAGGMAGATVPGRLKIPAILAGHFAGKGIGHFAGRDKEASLRASFRKIAQLDSPTGVGENEPMQDAYQAEPAPTPDKDEGGSPLPAEPFMQPDADLVPHPLDGILELLQKGNEAEHYEQKAEDALQVAEKARAAAELAASQLEATQKEQEINTQQQAEQLHAARAEASAAASESQAMHEQFMAGQQQVQQAQGQAATLLQSMNQFRQGLIDYLAQDPALAAVPGVMAPTPGSGQMLQDPTGQMAGMPGDPAAAGGQPGMPGPDGGAAPAPEEESSGGGGESGPPKEEKSEGKSEGGGSSEKSEGKSEDKPEKKDEEKGGDKKGVTVHVH